MENLPEFLHNSTVLLDTNFFINSYGRDNRQAYANFIEMLKSHNVAFVCSNLVKYEFIRSQTIDVVKQKETYFHGIIGTILPYNLSIDELIVPTMEEYGTNLQGLPLTDLIIAATLKKYKGLYLLTNDHGDFPTKIFERKHIFNIPEFGDKLYGLYTYKPKKETVLTEITSEGDIPF